MEFSAAFAQDVVDFGTDAVRHYSAMPVIPNETAIHEPLLSLFIANEFSVRAGFKARIEVPYMNIAQSHGTGPQGNMISSIGQWRSDFAVWYGANLEGVVELKLWDEGRPFRKILEDKSKLDKLLQFCNVPAYVAVLVCDMPSQPVASKLQQLATIVSHVTTGEVNQARGYGCCLVWNGRGIRALRTPLRTRRHYWLSGHSLGCWQRRWRSRSRVAPALVR